MGRSLSDYTILSKIGEGTFGKVYKATSKSDGRGNTNSTITIPQSKYSLISVVALKKIRVSTMNGAHRLPITGMHELRALRELRHENIVELTDFIYDADEGGTQRKPLMLLS